MSLLRGWLVNNRALVVKYQGELYFPQMKFHLADTFGQREAYGVRNLGEAEYRELQRQFAEAGNGNWVWMPPYP